jgi:hypothetical protein
MIVLGGEDTLATGDCKQKSFESTIACKSLIINGLVVVFTQHEPYIRIHLTFSTLLWQLQRYTWYLLGHTGEESTPPVAEFPPRKQEKSMNIEKLREELMRDIKRLTAAYNALSDPAETAKPTTATNPHRAVSETTRKKISKSMKKNWKTGKRSAKRKLSPEVRAKIASSQKKRWAAAKAASATVAASAPTQVAA